MSPKKELKGAKKIGVKKVKKLRYLLDTLAKSKAMDLILTTGAPPTLKRINAFDPISKDALTPDQIVEYLYTLLTPHQKEHFEKHKNIDFSFGIAGMARFRGNAYFQRGSVTIVFTAIPFHIPTWGEIKAPKSILPLLKKHKSGLIIITGPSGSGKSTIMASIVEHINSNFPYHVVTLEDPIEYIYMHKKSIISQRWVGLDTDSFASGLKYVLRQTPDVVAISEIRDIDTLSTAITLAEVGCLCIIQLHAPFAVNAIQKVVEIFPKEERENTKERLADNLLCIISSRLFVSKKGNDKIAAYEALINGATLNKLIKKGAYAQLRQYLKPSLKTSITKLKREGKIA